MRRIVIGSMLWLLLTPAALAAQLAILAPADGSVLASGEAVVVRFSSNGPEAARVLVWLEGPFARRERGEYLLTGGDGLPALAAVHPTGEGSQLLTDLPPGRHVIRLELADAELRPLGVAASVAIKVRGETAPQ